MIQPKIKSIDFHSEVVSIMEDLEVSCMDAVVEWCERNGVEVEQAGDWVKKDQKLRSLIQAEAEDLHFVKRTSRLPV